MANEIQNRSNEVKQRAEERFRWLLVALAIFLPTMTDVLLSNWLHRTFPSLPTILEYVLIPLPALIVVLLLYRYRAPIVKWFESRDRTKQL
jgi:hypothetical protein